MARKIVNPNDPEAWRFKAADFLRCLNVRKSDQAKERLIAREFASIWETGKRFGYESAVAYAEKIKAKEGA